MKKYILYILVLVLIIPTRIYAKEIVKFSKCVDGDTIKVLIEEKEYTVRMLAIDAPESVKPGSEIEYYGKEASEYTCKRITNATKIALEYDDNCDKFDKYDRLLAWVFVDDKLLEEELVEYGYAKVAYLYGEYKYTDILKVKQELASAKNIGIWNEEAKLAYQNSKPNEETNYENATNIEVIIITIFFLIFTFISSLFIKNKK